jgi:hypothetical protein
LLATVSRGLAGKHLKASRSPQIRPEEVFISRELTAHNRPVFDQLHPKIYGAAVSLVVWFALAAWLFFDRKNGIGLSNDIGLSLAIISVLLFVAVMIPWLLSLVWKKHRVPPQLHLQEIPFQDWRTGDVAVWGAKLRGTHAAIDVLLPLAAVAFGLTGIGIVFLVCAATQP